MKLNTIDGNKIKLSVLFIVLQFSLSPDFCPSHGSSGERTRKHSIHIDCSRVPASSTLREQSSIKNIIKHDNGIETRIKEMRGPR